MAECLTTKQIASTVGVTDAMVRYACETGKLRGAIKPGRDWLIPACYGDPVLYEAAITRDEREEGVRERLRAQAPPE